MKKLTFFDDAVFPESYHIETFWAGSCLWILLLSGLFLEYFVLGLLWLFKRRVAKLCDYADNLRKDFWFGFAYFLEEFSIVGHFYHFF